MKANFPASLGHVLQSEGGFVNDPLDNGGATNRGVTQAVYDNWRKSQGLPLRSVALINDYETGVIYKSGYWDKVRGDDLPSGIDYATFDYSVNSGCHRAVETLQRAVGAVPDGDIGPATLSALSAADPRRVIHNICASRLVFLQSLPTWDHFGAGWAKRVASVEMIARGMA